MAELFFDKLMGMLGVDTTPQEDQRDPLDTSDPQFGYRDYTPAERAQEVLYGSLDTAGSMLRGMGKAAIEAPRDIYALGSAIGKIQDRSRNRVEGEPVKTIGQLFTEAYREAPSFLPDEATAERILPEMTPMSRTYSQDASVYNLPEEFGRIAAPLPLLDYARPSQVARLGKAAKPTPRILDARDPITQNTDWRVPALEPLREPTRHGRYQAVGGDDSKRQMLFNDEILNQTDEQIIEKLKTYPDWDIVWSNARNKVKENMGLNPYGSETANQKYNIDILTNQEIARNQRSFQQQSIIKPTQERMSFMGQRPSYTAEEGRQILLDEAQRKYQNWKTIGQEMRDRGQQQAASFDLPKLIDRINNASDEQIFTTIKVEGLEPKKSPTPRILQEDVPKVEKLPPMLREPAQQARIFNEDGGTGTYSRVEQALLDIKNDPNVPASVTPRSLMQRLEAMGVTKADIEEHGLNLDSITRKNKHGHDVVDIQRVFDEVEPPQDRMSRVILDETGGGDADEMDLSGRRSRGELNIGDFWENEGNHRMDDWLYDYMGDIEGDYRSVGGELSLNTYNQQSSQTDEILEAISDRLKARGEAETDEEALVMAYGRLNEAIDGGGDWLADLDAELGGGIQSKAEEMIAAREIEFYNENPYIDDTIDFAGEEFKIFGNDDVGYRAWHNGNVIVDDVYSIDELEVQIQNWSMDQGYFGHGTGEGAMQWSQYLQGDSDYYTPLEEVILTYDPKSGRTFESSHYGEDIAEGYVSHMRTTSRETADGESVYHVDEIQSDLHQEGRQSGYSTPENREELLQANTDYDAAQASADRIYVELRDNIDIPDIQAISRKLDAGRLDRVEARFRDIEMTEEGRNHQRNNTAKFHVLDEITDVADPLKLLRDEGINDPDLVRYAEAIKAKRDAYSNVKNLERLGSAPDAEYPLKDERWIKAMVRQAMERAVSKGDFAGITFSNPQNQINQWSDRYAKLYNEVYENKLKSILETIGKEYGVKPKKVKLNDPEMQDAGENWYLPLTPEMTKSIQSRGVPLASAVGTTPMILDRINKEREDKTPRILRTA